MTQLDFRSRSRIKNTAPIPSVPRNPIATPPKNLRFLATRHRWTSPGIIAVAQLC